jgi:hypothetical protein
MSDTDALLIRNKRAQINILEKQVNSLRAVLEEIKDEVGKDIRRKIIKALEE